jgi:hypothetical protein
MNYKLHPYQENLCKEIMMTAQEQLCTLGVYYAPYIPKIMKPKYQFSRANWFKANFDHRKYNEVQEWCTDNFGPQPRFPDAWSRWVHTYEDQIFFRDSKDYEWFMLRWS